MKPMHFKMRWRLQEERHAPGQDCDVSKEQNSIQGTETQSRPDLIPSARSSKTPPLLSTQPVPPEKDSNKLNTAGEMIIDVEVEEVFPGPSTAATLTRPLPFSPLRINQTPPGTSKRKQTVPTRYTPTPVILPILDTLTASKATTVQSAINSGSADAPPAASSSQPGPDLKKLLTDTSLLLQNKVHLTPKTQVQPAEDSGQATRPEASPGANLRPPQSASSKDQSSTRFFYHVTPTQRVGQREAWQKPLLPETLIQMRNGQLDVQPAGGEIIFSHFQFSMKISGATRYAVFTGIISPRLGHTNWITASAAARLGWKPPAEPAKTTAVKDVIRKEFKLIVSHCLNAEFLSYSGSPMYDQFLICSKLPPLLVGIVPHHAYKGLDVCFSPNAARAFLAGQ